MIRVLFDCDGVIVDYIDTYLKVAAKFGIKRKIEEITQWDCEKSLGLSERENFMINQAMQGPGVAREMRPYPEAVDWVHKIARIADVYFVTSPYRGSPTWVHDRSEWLVRYFSDLGEKVIHTKHKELVVGDVFVDDKFEHVEKWEVHNPGKIAFLWGQEGTFYNGFEPGSQDRFRVVLRDWRILYGNIAKVAGVDLKELAT